MNSRQMIERAERKLDNAGRRLRFITASPRPRTQQIVFVAGCQRSGTTMTAKIFGADPQAFVFPEMSSLSSSDKRERLRFNDLGNVAAQIRRTRAPLVVAKPLVESARLVELLTYFPNSTVLWMVRDFRDVARSNLVRWGDSNGFDDLAPILARDSSDWRAYGLSEATIDLVTRLHNEGLSPADAACLFWYTRNTLLFDQNLEADPRIFLQRYSDLVADPEKAMRVFYTQLDLAYPSDSITDAVRVNSVGKGSDLTISREIETLCQQMLERLSNAVDNQGT